MFLRNITSTKILVQNFLLRNVHIVGYNSYPPSNILGLFSRMWGNTGDQTVILAGTFIWFIMGIIYFNVLLLFYSPNWKHTVPAKIILKESETDLIWNDEEASGVLLNQFGEHVHTIQRTVPASNTDSRSDSLFGLFIYPWGP